MAAKKTKAKVAAKGSATVATPLYKVLIDGKSCSGGSLVWSLPTDDGPGDWQGKAA